jgi:hypothetical protein
MYVVTLFNYVFLFNNNYEFQVKLSFNPKIFLFRHPIKKLCFFYLNWQHWIHKAHDQDKNNKNTA